MRNVAIDRPRRRQKFPDVGAGLGHAGEQPLVLPEFYVDTLFLVPRDLKCVIGAFGMKIDAARIAGFILQDHIKRAHDATPPVGSKRYLALGMSMIGWP
ncbi:MAG: hypothetical protein F9K41_10685 [Sphingopyxis terrae]|nr:MAG: hypothetical protein F9K41_10685 [Sphingopyxis terrae]